MYGLHHTRFPNKMRLDFECRLCYNVSFGGITLQPRQTHWIPSYPTTKGQKLTGKFTKGLRYVSYEVALTVSPFYTQPSADPWKPYIHVQDHPRSSWIPHKFQLHTSISPVSTMNAFKFQQQRYYIQIRQHAFSVRLLEWTAGWASQCIGVARSTKITHPSHNSFPLHTSPTQKLTKYEPLYTPPHLVVHSSLYCFADQYKWLDLIYAENILSTAFEQPYSFFWWIQPSKYEPTGPFLQEYLDWLKRTLFWHFDSLKMHPTFFFWFISTCCKNILVSVQIDKQAGQFGNLVGTTVHKATQIFTS